MQKTDLFGSILLKDFYINYGMSIIVYGRRPSSKFIHYARTIMLCFPY